MNPRICFRGCCYIITRVSSSSAGISKAIHLKGRDIVSPAEITTSDLKTILWTASEIKAKGPRNILTSKHVTYIYSIPLFRNQIPFERAVQLLGGCTSVFYRQDWEEIPHVSDCGRILSEVTDLVVTSGIDHNIVQQIANGASIPTISSRCNIFAIVKALADIFTLLETLGPLRRRTLAWVGPSTPISETYLCLMPKLGIKMRVHCFCPDGSGQVSPMNLSRAHDSCEQAVEIHECSSVEEAVYRADIVVTSPHRAAEKKITLKIIEEAELDWFFLHSLPRTEKEVSDEIFKHKNNLTWKSARNTMYIYMALLTRLLTDYELTIPMPDFDGPP